MKKNMLLAIIIATFFSCTEILDEFETIGVDPELTDSLRNVIEQDSVVVTDSVENEVDSTEVEEPSYTDTKDNPFYTKDEIEIWKERSKSPNFSDNWSRIEKNAFAFLSNPNAEIWSHNLRPMTKQAGGTNEAIKPIYQGIKLRDAAFKYLISGEIKFGSQVKETLLKQVREPSTNFSDRSYWQPNLGSFPPSFHCAEWALTLLFSYEYTKDLYSDAEKNEIESWFHKAALFFKENTDNELDKIFVDRQGGNYKLSEYTTITNSKNPPKLTHVGGHQVPVVFAYNYQNRQASQMRLVAYVGFLTNDLILQNSAKNFVKECVKFWAFPDGLTTEFERGYEKSRPEAGFYYSFTTLEQLLNISDLFARSGDFSLFDYETSEGWGGNNGSKSLWKVATTLCQLKKGEFYDKLTNSYSIYSIDKSSEHKIDGYDSNDVYSGQPTIYAKEIFLAQYNVYYNDPYIKECYENSLNTGGIRIASSGPHQNDQGVWGVHASKELMYANLEGLIWPYNNQNK